MSQNALTPPKSLYKDKVLPRLVEIEEWAIENKTQSQIAAKLGISYSIFRKYKEEYVELREVLEIANRRRIEQVEQALIENALPCVERKKTVITSTNKEGEETTSTKIEEVNRKGNFLAQQFFLTNKDPQNYQNVRSSEKRGDTAVNVRLPEAPQHLLEEIPEGAEEIEFTEVKKTPDKDVEVGDFG